MKRFAFVLALVFFAIMCYGQKDVSIKAGTKVVLQASYNVKAADVTVGQKVDFKFVHDLIVDDICVIPYGTNVKGKVIEAKKSSIAGTKGRLVIRIEDLILPNGEYIFFNDSEIRIYGNNRTPLAVVLCLIAWPCIFIPGSRAEMPEGYEVIATIASNCKVKFE